MTKAESLIKLSQWRSDIILFLKECFPHVFSNEFSYYHIEILKALQAKKKIVITAARGHGKSKVITFGWVIWNLLCNPDNKFTIIASATYTNACDYLRPIKEEIEHNPLINEVFGNLKSDKWSESEAEFTHQKKILTGGRELKIRGKSYLHFRPDLIVLDDIEDAEQANSQERRETLERWVLYSLTPSMTLTPKDQIIILGTIIHRASLISRMMETEGRYKEWHAMKYPALNRERTEALWPARIPHKWLVEEEKKDIYKFAQEFLCNPVPYEHAMFKEEYFDNYDDDKLPKNLIINITVDLACSDKEYSDYTVILPVGIDPLGDMWILPYHRAKYADPDRIIDEIFKMREKYKSKRGWEIGKLGIERNNFQRFLIKNFNRERKKRGLHFPVYEIQAKGDKVQRISQLQPIFNSGDIHIRADMLDLKQELLDFPRALHDDITDALQMQLEFMKSRPANISKTDEKWKITPEIQRKKILRKRIIAARPKINNVKVGV